jgi:hypothetical protein
MNHSFQRNYTAAFSFSIQKRFCEPPYEFTLGKFLAKLAGRELLLLGQFYFLHSASVRTVRLPGFGNFKDYSDYLAMAFTYHRTGRRFKYDLHITAVRHAN